MAKKRQNEWYRELIKKVGTEPIDNKEFWKKANEVSDMLGLQLIPKGSRGGVLARLEKTGHVDIIHEGRKSLIAIKNVDGLLKLYGEEEAPKPAPKPVKVEAKAEPEKESRTKAEEQKEDFIKYFKCVRAAVRSGKSTVELKKCMKANKLARIAGFHITAWAKTVTKLKVKITMPVCHKTESGTVVEFQNYKEDLLALCYAGMELYPEHTKEFDPENAFGDRVLAEQVKQQVSRKEEGRAVATSAIIPSAKSSVKKENRNRVIFLVAGKIFEKGEYQTLGTLKEYLKRHDIFLEKSEIRNILNTCPEIRRINEDSEDVYLRLLMKGETEKRFWDTIRDTYGPRTDEKEEILCRISMTKGEVTEYISNKTAEVSVVSRISDHDNIFRITVSKHSAVDKLNLIALIRCFRRDDVVLTRSKYTESLFEELKEADRSFKMDNEVYRYETGFFMK